MFLTAFRQSSLSPLHFFFSFSKHNRLMSHFITLKQMCAAISTICLLKTTCEHAFVHGGKKKKYGNINLSLRWTFMQKLWELKRWRKVFEERFYLTWWFFTDSSRFNSPESTYITHLTWFSYCYWINSGWLDLKLLKKSNMIQTFARKKQKIKVTK